MDTMQIKEHMPVVGSDGQHVGTVDKVEGSNIKLTKNDSPDGQHHYIPTSWVSQIDEHVHLSRSGSEAQQEWTSAEGSGTSM